MISTLGPPLRQAMFLIAVARAAAACGDTRSVSAAADPGSTATSSASASDQPKVSPLEQFVKVSKYGVGFGLPRDWVTVEAEDIKTHSPVTMRVSRQLGVTSVNSSRASSLEEEVWRTLQRL